jgi:hypothetical protein
MAGRSQMRMAVPPARARTLRCSRPLNAAACRGWQLNQRTSFWRHKDHSASLLFEGRRQLIVYRAFFEERHSWVVRPRLLRLLAYRSATSVIASRRPLDTTPTLIPSCGAFGRLSDCMAEPHAALNSSKNGRHQGNCITMTIVTAVGMLTVCCLASQRKLQPFVHDAHIAIEPSEDCGGCRWV